MIKKNINNRLKILEELMKSKKLDMILVFGSLQEFGQILFFTGVKPVQYHYFFVKKESPWQSGYFVPYSLARGVGKGKNVVIFDGQDILAEMAKFLKGKKRVGLIGGAPAFHFIQCEAEIVFLNEEIYSEMSVKNSAEIKKIKSAAEIAADMIKLGGRMIKAGASLGKISGLLEKKISSEGVNAPFHPIVSNMTHRPNLLNWISESDKATSKDAVMIDLGVERGGFYADEARMFFVNNSELVKIYVDFEICYGQFVAQLRPGLAVKDLFEKMDVLLQKKNLKGFKLNKNYLGHSVGFELFEHPFLIKNSTDILRNGMTISLLVNIARGKTILRLQKVILIGKKGGKILSA